MYRDARAEICALKAENKELKRQTTSMARFGAPTYLTFDGRRGADSGGGNTVVVLGGSTGDGPSNVLGGVGNTEAAPARDAQDKGKRKRSAEEAKK
ncbi:hypothetical protein LOK49_LG06G02520 [Camellia lanceoleosa]|uniref:Uncharacterized protein n=1 Tax=Camellia lanceoleosa TaxID=1840588 RepID=A0ACC0HKE1_9ERIC|nr:hypothetical protein LOK49_LG06G02520 [Camellia lanceoleosa]